MNLDRERERDICYRITRTSKLLKTMQSISKQQKGQKHDRAAWSRTTKRGLNREWSRAWETLPGKCDLKLNRKGSTRSMRRRFATVFFVRCCPTLSSFPTIGHFWITKTLTFKTRLIAKPFLCKWILFAWEYKKSSCKKSFKFIMPVGVLLVAHDSLKPFRRGRRVYMYTTQVNSAFRARWLASSVISQVLFTFQPNRREIKKHLKLITHCRIQKYWNFNTEDRETFGVLRLVHIKIDFIWWPE